ncbi:MAG: family 78 glycoside hydrolase catalytic domain, partial [bacterium]
MFKSNARWIWSSATAALENQYCCFRRDFTLKLKPGAARIGISADSDYQIFINGTEVYGRQFSDYPHHRSYDIYDVGHLLRRGHNTIAVLGYFRGRDASEYRVGHAGLIAQLDAGSVCIVTDAAWRCRRSPSFLSGPLPSVTRQMGITVQCDARREDAWTMPAYHYGRGWHAAVELAGPCDGYWRELALRSLPQMVRKPFLAGRPLCIGELQRPSSAVALEPALAMAADFKCMRRTLPSQNYPFKLLPPADLRSGGTVVLIDMGAETLGLLRMDIEAPAGTIIDIAHGEHLEDLGVRPAPQDRRFADRYICRAGHNRFELPFRRFGCRYIELHILNYRKPLLLHAAGLYPLEYPVQELGSFTSDDSALGDVRQVAVQTLKLCMGDHYFDCPWREQSLYAYDSRSQALYGYYAFGEYAFPQQSFRLLGWGRRDDGLIEMCAPAGVPVTIPVFSLAWICALHEHWLFSGSDRLFREYRATITTIFDAFRSRFDKRSGLYGLFDGKGYWAFYEWINELDYKREPLTGAGGKFRIDLPHNLYLLEAMERYAEMLALSGEHVAAQRWRTDAAALRRRTHAIFWDSERGCYASYADRSARWHYAAGVQALALCNGLGSPATRRTVRERMLNDSTLVPMTLQVMGYGCQALLGARLPQQVAMLQRIRSTFGGMLRQGATSLWEIDKIYDDSFAIAGSLCHAWSSVPVWLTQAYILGVRPLTPGFRRFTVNPHPCGLPSAAGHVPTPHGVIEVRWERGRGGEAALCQRDRADRGGGVRS